MTFFYNLLLFFIALCYLPKYLFYPAKRKLITKRLGFHLPPKAKDIIWIHAISLGETKSAKELIHQIRDQKPQATIYLSCVTETGLQEAQNISGIDHVFILPFDFSFLMKRLMRRIRPKTIILVETDFWYQFFKAAKKSGAKLILVSGKISKRSAARFEKMPRFTRALFSHFDLLCVQNPTYERRFKRFDVPANKIHITGNLKYDQKTPYLTEKELHNWKQKLGVFEGETFITIASTHAPEEKQLIKELEKIWETDLALKVFLAPRHPERFINVANYLRSERIPFIELSRIDYKNLTEKVILIDRLGFLPVCYQLSRLAIIGGSYTERVGGHNILEPNFYQLPVFFGPYMHAQKDLKELILKAQSGRELPLKKLSEKLLIFLQDEEAQKKMKEASTKLVDSLKGRINVTFDVISPYIVLPVESY